MNQFIVYTLLYLILITNGDNKFNRSASLMEDNCPKTLHRKRRYLAFPEDSHFVITVSLLKTTPFQVTVNTLHELDVALPLPKSLYPPVLFHSRKEKKILFKQIEAIIDMLGYNGKCCLQRLICEVMFLRHEFVRNSVVLQMLVLIFKISYEDSSKEIANKFVNKMKKLKKNKCVNKCKFSIFSSFLLKFD